MITLPRTAIAPIFRELNFMLGYAAISPPADPAPQRYLGL
jgi:hypothetical protein